MKVFVFVSFLAALMCYMNMDPMKSSFFLILSMLMIMPLIGNVSYVWYSYFISLLFLSGIFVILVYFSSLSSFLDVKIYAVFLLLIVSVLLYLVKVNVHGSYINLNVFYYMVSAGVMIWLVVVLLIFMNFCSYFLSFGGALRSV